MLYFFIATVFSIQIHAAPNYHFVGWFNTFVPGGGQALLGDPLMAGVQSTLEVSSFWVGFNMAGRNYMTLDGVPSSLPSRSTVTVVKTSVKKGQCLEFYPAPHQNVCKKFAKDSKVTSSSSGAAGQVDLAQPLTADIFQEFGIKYHMVNVFNAYREAAGGSNPMIDSASTTSMFLSPFRGSVMSDPWVWGSLGISAAALTASYIMTVNSGELSALPKFNRKTSAMYGFNNMMMFPTGSAAPEEMFYRGFLQNEFYTMVDNPYFSIAASTLAYSFSHSPEERPSAAVTGAFLGFLAHHNGGKLEKGIAYHFWANVMAGILQIELTHYAQAMGTGSSTAPLSFSVETRF